VRVPPTPVRRLLSPLVFVLLVLAVALLPVLVLVAAVASRWLPGSWRGLRLLWLALVYLLCECVGLVVAVTLWVASGFGRRLRTERFQQRHYAVIDRLLDIVVRSATRLFRLRLVTDAVSWSPLDDGVPGSTNAMVVLSRHAGPGDSMLLVNTLMNRDHLRRPRIVLKDTLQLDPLFDIYLNRLPNRFINPTPGRGEDPAAAIAGLATGMGEEDALLIFPEGGNFTPRRRRRGIDRLRHAGHEDRARRAEALRHLLPPKPGGVTAALAAAPHADVVFVAHTGLEHLDSLRDVWRALPEEKTLRLRWSFVPAADVPRDPDRLPTWLYDWWADIDEWIGRHQAAGEPPDAAGSSGRS
jgi:1-acyl-sn-glycerol-3-phosphate acyltransferase